MRKVTDENIGGSLGVNKELIEKAQRLEDDPKTILALIDLLFMGKDNDTILS